MAHRFDPKDIDKLENPRRLEVTPPDETLDQLDIKAGDRVADLGCGAGYYTFPLARRVDTSGVVYGVDIHEEFLRHCGVKAQEEGLTNMVFVLAEEGHIPLEDGIVDAVLMSNVLHEVEEFEPLLKEVKRIGNAGARLLVLEWKAKEMDIGPPIGERLSEEDAVRILREAGFTIDEVLDLTEGQYGIVALWEE